MHRGFGNSYFEIQPTLVLLSPVGPSLSLSFILIPLNARIQLSLLISNQCYTAIKIPGEAEAPHIPIVIRLGGQNSRLRVSLDSLRRAHTDDFESVGP